MPNEPIPISSIDRLPFISKETRNVVYDPQNPDIKKWLLENWEFGYNPLAVALSEKTNQLRLQLPNGEFYDYADPDHSYEHYRKNRNGELKFLGHITQTGWIEVAIEKQQGYIGSDDGLWTSSWDPQRWFAGKFPEGFNFKTPPDRFIELIFDAVRLKELGFVGSTVPKTDYYKFTKRLPLNALVPTSLAYINQVLGLTMPT